MRNVTLIVGSHRGLKITFFAVALASLSLVANTAQAVTLSNLISGTSLAAGDKEFTNFAFSDIGDDSVLASNIDVTSDATDPLNPGLTFSVLNGALNTDNGDGGGIGPGFGFFNVLISFTVSTTSAQPFIIGQSLGLTGTSVSAASVDGLINVDSVGSSMPQVWIDTFTGSTVLSDSAAFAGVATQDVELDVLVFSLDGETMDLTEFTVNFAQSEAGTGPVVPEPAAGTIWAVLGLTALLTGAASRRRKRAVAKD